MGGPPNFAPQPDLIYIKNCKYLLPDAAGCELSNSGPGTLEKTLIENVEIVGGGNSCTQLLNFSTSLVNKLFISGSCGRASDNVSFTGSKINMLEVKMDESPVRGVVVAVRKPVATDLQISDGTITTVFSAGVTTSPSAIINDLINQIRASPLNATVDVNDTPGAINSITIEEKSPANPLTVTLVTDNMYSMPVGVQMSISSSHIDTVSTDTSAGGVIVLCNSTHLTNCRFTQNSILAIKTSSHFVNSHCTGLVYDLGSGSSRTTYSGCTFDRYNLFPSAIGIPYEVHINSTLIADWYQNTENITLSMCDTTISDYTHDLHIRSFRGQIKGLKLVSSVAPAGTREVSFYLTSASLDGLQVSANDQTFIFGGSTPFYSNIQVNGECTFDASFTTVVGFRSNTTVNITGSSNLQFTNCHCGNILISDGACNESYFTTCRTTSGFNDGDVGNNDYGVVSYTNCRFDGNCVFGKPKTFLSQCYFQNSCTLTGGSSSIASGCYFLGGLTVNGGSPLVTGSLNGNVANINAASTGNT